MSKYLLYIFFFIMLVFVVIIQVALKEGNKSPGLISKEQDRPFTPLAEKIKKTKEEFAKAEANIKVVKINEEYETMVTIPEGYFTLGDSSGDFSVRPGRKVFLNVYGIDKYETTFAQYYQFVAITGHRKPRLAGYLAVGSEGLPLLMNPYNPVVGVSWDDAKDYCLWKKKRLPTEAEWEKAAKGINQQKWPWGNEENPMNGNFAGDNDGYFYTAPVGSFKKDKSPFGVYDMAGNVMEWVADWYDEKAYKTLLTIDPPGPERGQFKVIRGGSWNDSIQRGQTIIRFKMLPEYRDVTIGFRCAKNA
ncbi:MAG: formylglycine-generating enzyme family protein [Nitrospiria bacterium]